MVAAMLSVAMVAEVSVVIYAVVLLLAPELEVLLELPCLPMASVCAAFYYLLFHRQLQALV